LIDEISSRLLAETPAGSKVVLFGSQARNEEHEYSDVDVLVIEPSVADPMRESVRLRRSLRGLRVPVDVVVFSRHDADRQASVRGTLIERALREGTVLVDA
jgi:uncharacterized protein